MSAQTLARDIKVIAGHFQRLSAAFDRFARHQPKPRPIRLSKDSSPDAIVAALESGLTPAQKAAMTRKRNSASSNVPKEAATPAPAPASQKRARVLAALSSVPASTAYIAKMTGIPARLCSMHLTGLAKAGRAVKLDTPSFRKMWRLP